MIRKLAVLAMSLVAVLLAAPTAALGEELGQGAVSTSTPYPAPPVTSSKIDAVTTSAVLPTSSSSQQAAVVPSAPSGSGLAYTGISSGMIMLGAIAGVCVLAGIMLVALGTRRAIRRRPRHS